MKKLILVLDDTLIQKMDGQIETAEKRAKNMSPSSGLIFQGQRNDDSYRWGFEEGKAAAMRELLKYLKAELMTATTDLQCAKCGSSFNFDGETFLRAQKSGSGRAIRPRKRKEMEQQSGRGAQ